MTGVWQLMEEKTFSLGARLEGCASFVRNGKVPADIGTDHAYLPIWLVSSGIVPRAFASDINEEPIKSAKRNIEKCGLSEKVTTFTANGLDLIPPDDVDDIIIAGMGGDNIAAILSSAEWLKNPRYRLILQPMSRASNLREYLYRNRFEIKEEKAVCEAGRIYTVICAEYNDTFSEYDDIQVYVGKLYSADRHAAELLRKQAGILRSMADGYAVKGDPENSGKYSALAERLENYVDGRKTWWQE